jgi:HK97 family phage portal protein
MAATKRKPKRKPKVQALKQVADPVDPERRAGMTFVRQNVAGVTVNEDTALTQSTVWACQRVISETLAGMPWNTAKLSDDGTHERIPNHRNDFILNVSANPEATAFAVRDMLWGCAVIWGNGFAEIERDVINNAVNLWQIEPWRVELVRNESGQLFYKVHNYTSEPSFIPPRDMFHLKGPSPDGLWGWSVIRMHARTIGLAIAQEQNAASLNENDSTPGGVLEHPGRLTEQARQNLDQSWHRRHGGPKNSRRVAILEEGLKWHQTGLPPEDSKLIEQMQLTPSMICRIFRVPPHKVADLTRSTNNNIEHQDIEFVKDTLRPWAERGEAEADVKLFGRNNQGTVITVIDMAERERGDTTAQTNHVKEMLFNGVYSINEGRRYLGLPSIGPDGDKRFVQSAMVPLEMAGLQQEPASAPEADDEPLSESPTMDELEAELLPLLEMEMQRIIAREDANKHLTGERLGEWLQKHRQHCIEWLLPAAKALARLRTRNAAIVADMAVVVFLAKHFNEAGRDPAAKCQVLRQLIIAAAAAKEAA